MSDVIPAIMCGGAGTRLWPASRDSMPKQFIPLHDGLSTFQLTLRRLAGRPGYAPPLVIAHSDVRFIVAEQMQKIGVAGDIVLEPVRRDSAAAVAVAALHGAARDEEAVMLVLAADHLIDDDDAFAADGLAAAEAARLGHIMTLGVPPTRPETAYGYIRPGKPIKGSRALAVEAFVEKPDRARAEALVAEGCLWNSGNFLFRPQTMLAELERNAPEVLAAARAAIEGARRDLDFIRLDAPAFEKAPRISIDFAVMERTKLAGVLPVSFGWSDVGGWDALWQITPHDGDGNARLGNVVAMDTRNSYIQSDGILTAVLGVDDLTVVTTPDAVLVAHRSKAENVKLLVQRLREEGREEADNHLRMHRPWGWYQRVDLGDRFQVKRIMVKPGARLSLQKHYHRAEHWIVVKGTAEVTVGNMVELRHENEGVHIPIGAVHRLSNPGRMPLEMIEVQVGGYTGEDDIVRLEDTYNRL